MNYISENDAYRIGRVEFWKSMPGTWYRPSEWVFGYSRCPSGCALFEFGFFGFTILSDECLNP